MKKMYKLSRSSGISKLLLIMRITTLFLFIALLQVSAGVYSQDKQVSLKLKNASMEQLMEAIKAQSGYRFVYRADLFDEVAAVNLEANNKTVAEVLNDVLSSNGFEYELMDDMIIIRKAPEVQVVPEQQEEKEVKGIVTDEEGNSIPGVSVVVKGTTNGTATDIDGHFTIDVEEGDVLVFSFVGLVSQEITYDGTGFLLNVVLFPDSEVMDEVLVVGYGTQNKERIGSAIAQVKAEEIEERAAGATSFEQILGGQIKGVQISQSSGAPGAQSTVRVRGITSPFASGNNQPLYVVDGVIFNVDATFDAGLAGGLAQTENPLLSINPNDIESISVLKDAGATSIYGSRGANGVIIITTKKGRKNTKNSIRADYTFSVANPVKTQDVLGVNGYKDLHKMIANNTMDAYAEGFASMFGYNNAALVLDPATREFNESIFNIFTGEMMPTFGEGNTDWQDEIYRNNAQTHQWNLSMSGGNDNTDYSFSLNHTDQQGMIINDNLQRYGARMNVNSKVKSWLKFGGNLSYSYTKNANGESREGMGAPTEAMKTRPDYPVYDDNGNFVRVPDSWVGIAPGMGLYNSHEPNPVANREHRNINNSNFFNGNTYMTISPVKGLDLRAEINVGSSKTVGESFSPTLTQALSLFDSNIESSLSHSLSQTTTIISNFQANYNKVLAEKHFFDLMAGYSVDRRYYARAYQSYRGTLDDEVMTNTGSAKTHLESQNSKAASGVNSFYSRLQYSYAGKYTATFNLRSDESSKFSPGNRVAYFPSVAVNWNAKAEEFLAGVPLISNLKLRTSYGKTGSANVNDFSYLQYFGPGTRELSVYEDTRTIIHSPVFPNRNIKWETTREFNVGLDFGLLDDRIYGSLDIYDKYTDGILTPSPIYKEAGSPEYTSNLAEISNKGLELELGAYLIRNSKMTWSLNLNYAYNRNNVESIKGNGLKSQLLDSFIEGHPVGAIKGYVVEKIIQTPEEITALNEKSETGIYHKTETGPGDYLYKDTNGDKRITADDRVVLGSMEPDFFGGFSTNFNYKGIGLGAFFQYSVGNEKIWTNYLRMIGHVDPFNNAPSTALNETWTSERTDAKYSRLVYGYYENGLANSRNIQDASYLRLKVLRLSYNLPSSILDKFDLDKVQVFASASNLLTFTKYEGLDPEGGGGSILGGASSSDPYPFAKTVSLGLSVNF